MSKEKAKVVNIESTELYQLVKRIDTAKAKPEDLARLRKELRGNHSLCKQVLDLTELTETQLIESLAGDSVLVQEVIREDLAHRRRTSCHGERSMSSLSALRSQSRCARSDAVMERSKALHALGVGKWASVFIDRSGLATKDAGFINGYTERRQ